MTQTTSNWLKPRRESISLYNWKFQHGWNPGRLDLMMVFYFNSVFLPIHLALFTPVVSFFSSSLHMLAPKVPDLQILTAIPHFSFSKSSNKTTSIEAHWHILGHRPPPKLGTTVLMQAIWTEKIGEGDSPKEN